MASDFKLSSPSSEIDRLVIGHVQTDSLTSTVQTEEPPAGLSRMIPGESSSPEPHLQPVSSSSTTSSLSMSAMASAAFEPPQTKTIAPVKYSPTNFGSWNDIDDAIDDVSRFLDQINMSSQEPESLSHSSNISNQLPLVSNSESSSLNIPENDRETDVDGANVQDCLKTAAGARKQVPSNSFECESDDRNSISSSSRQEYRKREKSHRSSRAKSPKPMPSLPTSVSYQYLDSECGNRTDDTEGKRSERKHRSSGTAGAKPKEKRRHRSHRSSKNATENWWHTMADPQHPQQLPHPFPYQSSTKERSRKSSFSESYAPSEYSQQHLEAQQNWNKYYEAMQMNMLMMNPYYNSDYMRYQNWLIQKQQYAHPMANYPPMHPMQSLNYAQQFSNAAAYGYPAMASASFNPNDYNRNLAQSADVNDFYSSQKSLETKSNSFEYEQDNGLKKFATQHSHVNISCGNLITCNSKYLLMEGSGSGSGGEGCSPVVQVANIGSKCKNSAERRELKQFPGPLIEGQTHKTTVIEYCEDKIRDSISRRDLSDIDSYNLIWEFLILVIRQNGSVDGADISDLLMKNEEASTLRSRSSKDDQKSSSSTSLTSSLTDLSKKSLSKIEIMDKYRQYLFRGDLSKALEWSMSNGLWDHALFLSSRMDKRTYATVLAKFEAHLANSDPIQTLYQFMSQKKPTFVSTFAGDKINEWRKHLAIMIANMVHEPEIVRESIINMGDVLFAKNKLYAAQFCYLIAKVEFGKYNQEGVKLVLLGSSQSNPSFSAFATNEAIMMTEIYEYICQMDASQSRNMSNLLPYKYTLATRMIDCGLIEKAMLYLEQIAKQLCKNFEQNGSPSRKLVRAVHDLSERLQYQVPVIEDVDGLNWIQKLERLLGSREQQIEKREKKTGYLEPISEIPTASELENESNASKQQQFEPQLPFRTQTASQMRPQQRRHPAAGFQSSAMQQPLPSTTSGEEQQRQPPQQFPFNSQSSLFDPMQNSAEKRPLPLPPQPQQQPNQMHSQPQTQETQQLANPALSDYNLPLNNFSKPNITLPNQNVSLGGDEKPKQNYFDEHSLSDRPLSKSLSSQSSPSGPSAAAASGDSKLGWAFSALTKLLPKTPKQVHLPDDSVKNIVFDKKTERWINKAENGQEANGVTQPPPPPPKSASFTNLAYVANATSPMASGPPNPQSQQSEPLPGLFSSSSYESLLPNSLPANINNSKNTIPMMSAGSNTTPPPSSSMPPINNVNSYLKPQPSSANMYRLQNNRGAKKMYVNVLSQQKPMEERSPSAAAPAAAPSSLPLPMPVSPNNYFNQMTGTNPVSPIGNSQADATAMAPSGRNDSMDGRPAVAPPVQLFTPPMNSHSSFTSPFSTSAAPGRIDPSGFAAQP